MRNGGSNCPTFWSVAGQGTWASRCTSSCSDIGDVMLLVDALCDPCNNLARPDLIATRQALVKESLQRVFPKHRGGHLHIRRPYKHQMIDGKLRFVFYLNFTTPLPISGDARDFLLAFVCPVISHKDRPCWHFLSPFAHWHPQLMSALLPTGLPLELASICCSIPTPEATPEASEDPLWHGLSIFLSCPMKPPRGCFGVAPSLPYIWPNTQVNINSGCLSG